MEKGSKNELFGTLCKIESLVFARNGLKWSILWLANFLRISNIWENSHLEIYVRKLWTNQIARFLKTAKAFELFINIEKSTIRRLRWCHFSGKMPFCPKKGQKGAKVVGRAVGQNQLFRILLKIGSLDFFDILHEVRGHKLIQMPFFGKILIFPKKEKRVKKWAKMSFLDFCGKSSH